MNHSVLGEKRRKVAIGGEMNILEHTHASLATADTAIYYSQAGVVVDRNPCVCVPSSVPSCLAERELLAPF